MKYFIFCVSLFFSASLLSDPTLEANFKPVKLEEFTTLSLKIMPDAGTQLIFPFLLDNPELKPTLKLRLTNANGFEVPHTADDISASLTGQNTITIIGKFNETSPKAIYLGNLFITVGGYNLSIALKTTLNPKEHISNIVFNIDDTERHHLVEQTVKYRTKQLEDDYKRKVANLDNAASDHSLKYIATLALIEPSTTRYKESGTITIDDGRIEAYADKVMTYGEEYSILLFELENLTNKDYDIKGIDIVVDNGDTVISGSYNCNNRLRADTSVKCGYVSSRIFAEAKQITMVIRTNRGQGEFKW